MYTMTVPPIEELQALLISDSPAAPMLADTATTPESTATDGSEALKSPSVTQFRTNGGGLYTMRGGTLYASTATSGSIATQPGTTANVTAATATETRATGFFGKRSTQKKTVENILASGNIYVCVYIYVCMYVYTCVYA
jgi:hypothetical protein